MIDRLVKDYYEKTFDVMQGVDPDMVAHSGLKRGEAAVILPMEMTVSDDLRNKLYESVSEVFDMDGAWDQTLKELAEEGGNYLLETKFSR